MKRALLILPLIAVTAVGTAAAADLYTIDTVHSDVGFKIRHLVSRTAGQFNDFDGAIVADWDNPERSSVKFTIDAASIDTDNADRDKHLRSADFFDVETYPEITFKSVKIVPTGEDTYDVHGDLTMRGVTRRVTLPVVWLGQVTDPWGNTKAGFETEITLDRKEYGIEWNKALDAGGLVLGNDVEVEISLEVQKKDPEAATE